MAWQAGVPQMGLFPLHLRMPPVAFGTCLRLNADRRVTAVRGCAAQGLCKACTQAGWDVASPLYKVPLFPSELLARQAGHGKAQPKEPTQQHPCEDGAAAPGFAGQASPLCNPVVLPPPCSASWHQVRVSQPRCPRDSRPRVQGFPADHARQRERKKKDEFLLRTLGRHKQGKPGKHPPGSSLSEGAEWPAPVLRPGF